MSINVRHDTNDISTNSGSYPTIGGKAYLPYEIQPITASVGSNALTIILNPTVLDFRSSTVGAGDVNRRSVPAAISVTVSSGSTLGTVNSVQNRLAVLAIDNAGTVELAVVNLAGGNNLDETTLISTTAEGGAGGADSASIIYSTTARTNVPFRVVGFVESTQTTAGTWVTAPSTIQGAGGNAMTALQSIGFSQTRQNLTASRALNTTYYNTTGRPIFISVTIVSTALTAITLVAAGIPRAAQAQGSTNTSVSIFGLILPGESYSVTNSAGTPTLQLWEEIR